jgi:mono/diheme cytochrome c family protein
MMRPRSRTRPLCAALLLGAGAIVAGCSDPQPPAHLFIAGGDAERGRKLIRAYGCGVCHRIDGIRGAHGLVGPPLEAFAQRKLLAGVLPNAPRFLVSWLIDPPALVPHTGMPAVGLNEAEARDIATYLYTLGAAGAQVYPDQLPLPLDRRDDASKSEPRN